MWGITHDEPKLKPLLRKSGLTKLIAQEAREAKQFCIVTEPKLGLSIFSIPQGEEGKHPPKQLFSIYHVSQQRKYYYSNFMQYHFSAYKPISCLLGKKKSYSTTVTKIG
jgi:hypothetical protein